MNDIQKRGIARALVVELGADNVEGAVDATLTAINLAIKKELSRLSEENEGLRAELLEWRTNGPDAIHAICNQRDEAVKENRDLRAKVEKMEKALGKCVTSLDGLYTFHRHSPVWNTLHTTEALEEGKQALSHLTGEKKG